MSSQDTGQPGASEAERELFRRKLAEWRAMGFDVSALEVLLETDIEKFKAQRFELMRRQIMGGPPHPSQRATAAPQDRPAARQNVLNQTAFGQPDSHQQPSYQPERSLTPPNPPVSHPSSPGTPASHSSNPHSSRVASAFSGTSAHHSTLQSADNQELQEPAHSEMRYPSARRHAPETRVKTFSVLVEDEQRVAVVDLTGRRTARLPEKGAGKKVPRPLPGKRPVRPPVGGQKNRMPSAPDGDRVPARPRLAPSVGKPAARVPARPAQRGADERTGPAERLRERAAVPAARPLLKKKLVERPGKETMTVALEEEPEYDQEEEQELEDTPETEDGEDLPVVDESEDRDGDDYLEEESTYDEYDREEAELVDGDAGDAADDDVRRDADGGDEDTKEPRKGSREEAGEEEQADGSDGEADGEADDEEDGGEEAGDGEEEQEEDADSLDDDDIEVYRPPSRVPTRPIVRRKAPKAGTKSPERTARKVAQKRPLRRKRRDWTTIGAIAVIIIVVIAALGLWWTANPPESVKAKSWHPASASAGELVPFDGKNSSASGSRITRYEWTFGDGSAPAVGRFVHHVYSKEITGTVTLTVTSDKGTKSSHSSKITIGPLGFTVPAKKLDDKAYYNITGSAAVHNNDTGLYTITLGPTSAVTVKEIYLNFCGTLSQWIWDVSQKEDGFKQSHTALRTHAEEKLVMDGSAITTATTLPLSGQIDYKEDSYADPASGGIFQSYSTATTRLTLAGGVIGGAGLNSTDSLRAYPNVAGITDQFQIEKVYKGRRLDQSAPSSLTGSVQAGNATYSWAAFEVENIGGYASMRLHVTSDTNTMAKYGFTEFFIDVWVSGSCSLPTKTYLHVAGRSGDATYSTDHVATMTSKGFVRGSGTIDTAAQQFTVPALPADRFSAFSDVPAAGNGSTGLRFTPEEAREAAKGLSADFAQFIAGNPQSYAVDARYHEGTYGPQSASWNLTFSWPGAIAGSGYWVNVTKDMLQNYTARGDRLGSPPNIMTAESSLPRLLTVVAAEEIFRNDSDTQKQFFPTGNISFGGASLQFRADHPYPSLNLVSMYAASERAGYAALLEKEGKTSAISMETGQMIYFWTHVAS